MRCSTPADHRAVLGVTGDVMRPGGLDLTDRAVAACCLDPGSRVIDVGCGTGAAVSHLRSRWGFSSWGIDVFAAMPGFCIRAAADMLPVKTGAVDCVLCECVLSILSDADRALREFCRVLRQGGMCIVSDVYDRDRAGSIQDFFRCCGFRMFLWEDHTRALRELGANMVLQGVPCSAFSTINSRTGYYLLAARKDTFHG